MKQYLICFFLIFLSSSMLIGQSNSNITQEQKSWLSKSFKYEKNGWIYLHIEGEAKQRGFQHGYLLAKQIEESINSLSKIWNYRTGMSWEWLVKESSKFFLNKVNTENLDEIDGIVEGLKAANVLTSRSEIGVLNGWYELHEYWWPTVKDSLASNSQEPRKESCSAFIATGNMTTDGRIVLGHNTWFGYEEALCNIIIDILPEKGHRILMQTFPGYIHSGTDFFITNAGLLGAETTMNGFSSYEKNGVPEFSRMREATQYASSIDEWCEIIKKGNNGGYANAWLIGDLKTNEIARLELGLKHIGFEKKKDGYFVGSNVTEDLKILRFETNQSETNIKNSSIARHVRWKQLMNQNTGKIDLELAQSFLADHYDVYLKTNNSSLRSICYHGPLDPMYYNPYDAFEPWGCIDGKVVDSKMAEQMSFIARWGSSCGTPFDTKTYFQEQPQFEWMKGILKDRPSEPWTVFRIAEF